MPKALVLDLVGVQKSLLGFGFSGKSGSILDSFMREVRWNSSLHHATVLEEDVTELHVLEGFLEWVSEGVGEKGSSTATDTGEWWLREYMSEWERD